MAMLGKARLAAIAASWAALALAACSANAQQALPATDGGTFTNPLLPSGPDPWVTAEGGVFYYTSTQRGGITLWRTRDITDLADAGKRVVWTPPATGSNAHSIWAPELHRIAGKWYIYYSATASGFTDDAHRGVFVLENSARDPMQGEWIDRGRVNTARAGIDGTVFEHKGSLYFAYSPYVGPVSGIALARMANPWTIAGEEKLVAEPDKEWEDRGGRKILEGPEFLKGPKGQVFLTYSAGACWSDDYALGLLRADAGADLLARASWTKYPRPVLASANGIFATGHNGFFRSPDGREQWIIYHANPGPEMGCTPKRAPHLGRVTWNAKGEPVFDQPVGPEVRLRKPSGTRK